MPTPPARRRVHPAVAVRRAQSERRYLSPWQAGAAPPLLHVPPGSGWARFEHHHATRTAYIPPLHPRLCHPQGVGRPKVVMGVREVWTGTVSYHPCASMSRAQLPPLALGSPPAVAAPHTLLPPPITLEDRLAQDRLTAFLAAESLPHRPRSILSCPGRRPRRRTFGPGSWLYCCYFFLSPFLPFTSLVFIFILRLFPFFCSFSFSHVFFVLIPYFHVFFSNFYRHRFD